MSNTFYAADLFCGAGGETSGMMAAAGDLGMHIDLLAINHWEMAIETHSRNHPEARHLCESIQSVDPAAAIPGGRLGLLWASPECTHHSNARGGRPRSNQSRASAWLILKWLSELYVDRVIVENVPEFLNWGPLGANGKPLVSRRGEAFRAWVAAMEALGYRVDWRMLRAADYGDPTTRTRLFVQAARGRKRIVWPEPTHCAEPEIFNRSPWVAARDIIDWSIPGQSIFTRKKPLADATLARIEAGIRKYWGELAEPFLVILRGTGTARDINRPMPTVTAGGLHVGLVEPFLVQSEHGIRHHSLSSPMPTVTCSSRGFGLVEPFVIPQHSGGAPRSVSNPLPTVATAGAISVVEPFITILRGCSVTRAIGQPLPTVSCSGAHYGVVEPFLVKYYGSGQNVCGLDSPLDTVTTNDRFGLVGCDPYALDIRFRMLAPHELAAAQGFPADYWFSGNKTQQVKQIGNAVPCNLARAICREAFAA